jgi:hypothetical protein
MLSLCKVKLIRDFLAFFKPTDADASVLLTAYGIQTIDVERLESSRSADQTETDRASDRLTHRQPIAEPPLPVPIGIRSDITWIRRTAITPKRHRTDYPETLDRLAARSSIQVLQSSHPDRREDDRSNGSNQSKSTSSTPANLSNAFADMVEQCRFDLPESSSEERDRIGIPDIIGAVIIVGAVVLLIQRFIFA